MVVLRIIWRMVRHRWTRRILVWVVVRLIRLFGWRRAVKLLFRGRGRWRLLAAALWRAAVRLLRVGRRVLILTGRPGPGRQRLMENRAKHDRGKRGWRRRIALRRDELRRSALAAVGVDPEWRPPSRRRLSEATVLGLKGHSDHAHQSLH